MVRQFPGLTIINAGTLRSDHQPGFLLLNFATGHVEMLRWQADQIVLHQREQLAVAP